MNYKLTKKEVTVDAGEFVRRYRNVERFAAFCAQCPSHGNSWGCPPFSFNPATVCDGFKTVTLMGTTIAFDETTIAACRGAKAKSRQVAAVVSHSAARCVLRDAPAPRASLADILKCCATR